MAINRRISQLNNVTQAAAGDLLAIVDVSASPDETKNISISDLMASPGPIGLSNPNQSEFTAVTMVNTVSEFSIDGTFVGNSDTAVPTEKAVKTYVDNAINFAVRNVQNISYDTTASGGDLLLVDTTGGDVNIELVPGQTGRILILKNGVDNDVIITAPSGLIYDGGIVPSITISLAYASKEFLYDGTNFYVI